MKTKLFLIFILSFAIVTLNKYDTIKVYKTISLTQSAMLEHLSAAGQITKDFLLIQPIIIEKKLLDTISTYDDDSKLCVEIFMANYSNRRNHGTFELLFSNGDKKVSEIVDVKEIGDNYWKDICFSDFNLKELSIKPSILTIKGIDSPSGNAVTVGITADNEFTRSTLNDKSSNALLFKLSTEVLDKEISTQNLYAFFYYVASLSLLSIIIFLSLKFYAKTIKRIIIWFNPFSTKYLLKNDIIFSTIIVTILLLIIDISIRDPLYGEQYKGYIHYILAGILTSSILMILKFFIDFFKLKLIRIFLLTIISIIMAEIYIFQYSLFNIYKEFASVEIITTLVFDYMHWLLNSASLIQTKDILFFILFFFIFYSYFSGLITKLIDLKYRKMTTRFARFNILFLVLFIISMLVSHNQIKNHLSMLLPFESLAKQILKYKKLKPHTESIVIVRDHEKIQKKELDFNILLVVNESLRSDHLGLFGYKRDISPNIDKFFKDSYKFKNTISQTAVTPSALQAIFTGTDRHDDAIDDKTSTFWSYMKQVGYNTFYFGSQHLSWSNGFHRWFLEKQYINKIFSPITSDSAVGHDDGITLDAFENYFVDIKDNFFGVVHLNATHFPYIGHRDTDKFFPAVHSQDISQIDGIKNAYDNSIIHLDNQFQRIVEALKKENKLEDTVIVFLSDHAEAFGEHDVYFHTNIQWIEALRSPLMIYIPQKVKDKLKKNELDNIQSHTSKYVGNTDLFPTILRLLEIKTKKKLDGQSLFDAPKDGYVFSTMNTPDTKFSYTHRLNATKYTFDNVKNKIYSSNLNKDELELSYTAEDAGAKYYKRVDGLNYIKNIDNRQ